MAFPAESKVDENEVTSQHHHRQEEEEEDAEVELGFAAMRQSSIYSLTLDEIQNTVCEPGKDFSSMNMGEFLSNIWNVEETGFNVDAGGVNLNAPAPAGPPLARQGSISVPAPLCRKTVDEVWAEIHREGEEEEEEGEHLAGDRQSDVDRQPTMGEMTLEDFLVKAGLVRECFGPTDLPPPPAAAAAAGMVIYPDHVSGAAGLEYYQYQPHEQQVAEGHGASASGKGHQLRLGSAASPVSSDGGMGTGHVDNGRKRTTDGGSGGGVERRQKRMIKNRESAARSRARKQAYTVELEAELNLLKEDNARLRGEERRAHAMRKKMITECMAEHARNNAEKTARTLRRCTTSPW